VFHYTSLKVRLITNTLAYWADSKVTKKIDCCEYETDTEAGTEYGTDTEAPSEYNLGAEPRLQQINKGSNTLNKSNTSGNTFSKQAGTKVIKLFTAMKMNVHHELECCP
jgi:hypothetical protein